VELDDVCRAYVDTVLAWEPMAEWVAAAESEPDELDDLEMEF
jgi:glutathione S-transferase